MMTKTTQTTILVNVCYSLSHLRIAYFRRLPVMPIFWYDATTRSSCKSSRRTV